MARCSHPAFGLAWPACLMLLLQHHVPGVEGCRQSRGCLRAMGRRHTGPSLGCPFGAPPPLLIHSNPSPTAVPSNRLFGLVCPLYLRPRFAWMRHYSGAKRSCHIVTLHHWAIHPAPVLSGRRGSTDMRPNDFCCIHLWSRSSLNKSLGTRARPLVTVLYPSPLSAGLHSEVYRQRTRTPPAQTLGRLRRGGLPLHRYVSEHAPHTDLLLVTPSISSPGPQALYARAPDAECRKLPVCSAGLCS